MVNTKIKKLINPERLSFDVEFLDDVTGTLDVSVKNCTVCKGYLNGPAIKLGSVWLQIVTFDGDVKRAIIESLKPWHEKYPGVQFPKE